MTFSKRLLSTSKSDCSAMKSLILILFRISSIVALTSMNLFSFAERITRTPSSDEESLEPGLRYLEGPASESEDEDEDEEDDDPEPLFLDPFFCEPDAELLLLESESLPLESSPPQNLEAYMGCGEFEYGGCGQWYFDSAWAWTEAWVARAASGESCQKNNSRKASRERRRSRDAASR